MTGAPSASARSSASETAAWSRARAARAGTCEPGRTRFPSTKASSHLPVGRRQRRATGTEGVHEPPYTYVCESRKAL